MDVLERVRFTDHHGHRWLFRANVVSGLPESADQCWLQVTFPAVDIHTGELENQRGRKWLVSPFATDSEIVFTALAAVKMALHHKAHESFLVDGQRLVAPHVDAFALADAVTHELPQDARQHLDPA